MTIIAIAGRHMCADSAAFQNGLMFPCQEPKIFRLPDGGLIGSTGATSDCATLRAWALAGMLGPEVAPLPRLSYPDPDHEHSVMWLWLKPDGTAHMGDCTLRSWRAPNPIIIGIGAQFMYGLLDAGIGLHDALVRTIARHPFLGGAAQIEDLPPVIRADHPLVNKIGEWHCPDCNGMTIHFDGVCEFEAHHHAMGTVPVGNVTVSGRL